MSARKLIVCRPEVGNDVEREATLVAIEQRVEIPRIVPDRLLPEGQLFVMADPDELPIFTIEWRWSQSPRVLGEGRRHQ